MGKEVTTLQQQVLEHLDQGAATLSELQSALSRTDLGPIVADLVMDGVLIATSVGAESYYETLDEYEPADEHYCCGCWQCLPDV